MLARLGQVLYWTACALAILMLAISAAGFYNGIIGYPWIFLIGALITFLIGRAILYILAGK
jgi:hypothetical protein